MTKTKYPASGRIESTKKIAEPMKRTSIPGEKADKADKIEKKSTINTANRLSAKDVSTTASKSTGKK